MRPALLLCGRFNGLWRKHEEPVPSEPHVMHLRTIIQSAEHPALYIMAPREEHFVPGAASDLQYSTNAARLDAVQIVQFIEQVMQCWNNQGLLVLSGGDSGHAAPSGI